MQFKDKRWER